jgi:DNA-binding IclR family transcriptional regulator
VLEILERHPRGIGARDIGNELGIDWRRVIGVMSGLVGRGLVDQIEQDFYRAGKASPRC